MWSSGLTSPPQRLILHSAPGYTQSNTQVFSPTTRRYISCAAITLNAQCGFQYLNAVAVQHPCNTCLAPILCIDVPSCHESVCRKQTAINAYFWLSTLQLSTSLVFVCGQKEDAAITSVKKALKVLDSYLLEHTFLVGESVTLADIVGASNLYLGFTLVSRL